MKTYVSGLLLLANLTFIACEPPVTFTEPQPVDSKNISHFPKRMQGKYLNAEDSSLLEVGERLVVRTYTAEYRTHRNELDSTLSISGDTLVDIRSNEKMPFRMEGDTLMALVTYSDTLFQIDYDNVVRKMKGYYFLNTRSGKESWSVQKISLSKGVLLLSHISVEDEIKSLQEITESPIDTVAPFAFTPTKAQFRKFVKKDGFSEGERFVRLK